MYQVGANSELIIRDTPWILHWRDIEFLTSSTFHNCIVDQEIL